MKTIKKITNALAKVSEWIVMALVAAIVVLIVSELVRRNILNKSWLPTTEACGILFLWMAFIGLIPLYNTNGLMRLDFLVSRFKGTLAQVVWYLTAIVSMALGIVMIVAFAAQYPYVSSRTYATMPTLHYTIQYIPMVIAGIFFILKSIEQIISHTLELKGGKAQ